MKQQGGLDVLVSSSKFEQANRYATLMLVDAMSCYAIRYIRYENASSPSLALFLCTRSRTWAFPSKRTPRNRFFSPQHTFPTLLIRSRLQLPIWNRTLARPLSRRSHTPNQRRRTRRHTRRTPPLTGKVTRILNTLSHLPPALTRLSIPPLIFRLFTTHIPRRRILTPRMLKVFLSASFDGTFVVRVKTNSTACISADALAILGVRACAGGCAVFEEEVEEFVFDGEMGGLAELLEGG
jgi:hypothetical protein